MKNNTWEKIIEESLEFDPDYFVEWWKVFDFVGCSANEIQVNFILNNAIRIAYIYGYLDGMSN